MVERRLATVLACDVSGFARLMGRDDEGTLRRFERHRSLIAQVLVQHGGRPFGDAGDSLLAEFASPVEAVRCAVDMQLALHDIEAAHAEGERMRWRIGINLGDVMAENERLVGDGVNVAARLESLARPGGICLSASVAEHVREHVQLDFEDLGRQRLKNIARPVQAFRIPLPSDLDPAPPYRGLLPFDFGEAALFHGRSRAIAETVERLCRRANEGSAFLLVYGMSGVGKSSLVRAGLIPALMRAGTVPETDRWLWCAMRPSGGPTPLAAMTASLGGSDALGGHGFAAAEVEQLIGQLIEDSTAASARLRAVLGTGRTCLLLLVDQLEELLSGDGIADAARRDFVAALAALAASGVVWVVATLRSDFYHRCSEVAGLAELKDGWSSYELLQPTPAEIGQIIREPARRAGLRFEQTSEEGRLDDVLHHDAVRDRIPLPLLSFTLAGLYGAAGDQRRLSFADYRALGGFEGAIAKRAEEVVRALPAAVVGALPAVLRAVVTLGGDAVTARSARYAEVASTPERAALVDALVAARLLVLEQGSGEQTEVRLAHEALTTHWPRAREQIQANRDLLAISASLEIDLERWERSDRNPDMLLPAGRRLAEAQELAELRGDELKPAIVRFVEASRALREGAARRSLNRLRLLAASMAVLACAAGWLAWSSTVAEREAEQSRSLAADALRDAAEARDRAEAANSRLLARRAQEAVADAQLDVALALALEALPRATEQPSLGPDTQQAGWALLDAVAAHRRLAVLDSRSGAAEAAVFSPDGRTLATANQDGRLLLWDVDTGRLRAELAALPMVIWRIAYSPDGRLIAGTSWDETVHVWNVDTGEERLALKGHSGKVYGVAFSPDGKRLLSSGSDGTARLWDAATGQAIAVMAPGDGEVWSAKFDASGSRVATGAENGMVRFWDGMTGAAAGQLRAHERRVWDVAYGPDGHSLVTASQDGTAKLWDTRDLTLRARLMGHKDWVLWASFSPDGRRLATSSADQTVRLWDVATAAPIGVVRGHRQRIWTVAFDPAGQRLVTASQDGTTQLWDVSTWQLPLAVLDAGRAAVSAMAMSGDGATLAIGTVDGDVALWDVGAGRERGRLAGAGQAVVALDIVGDDLLVVGAADGRARLIGMDRLETLATLGSGAPMRAAALSADRGLLALGREDGAIELWDVPSRSRQADLHAAGGAVARVLFTPSGRELVTASNDGTATVWDLAARHERARMTLGKFTSPTDLGAFERPVALVPNGHAVRIVDLQTGEPAGTVEVPQADVASTAVAGAGRRWAIGTATGTVYLVDSTSRGGLGLFEGHQGAVTAITMSDTGSYLATASTDGTVRIWRAPPWQDFAALMAHARSILPPAVREQVRSELAAGAG